MCPKCTTILRHTLKSHKTVLSTGRTTDDDSGLEEQSPPPTESYKRVKTEEPAKSKPAKKTKALKTKL